MCAYHAGSTDSVLFTEKASQYVTQAGLALMILMPLPPECFMYVPPYLTGISLKVGR